MPILRAIALASGSKGNSIFIESGGTRLLVDAGVSCKQICLRLESVDINPDSIDAILVTHEHSDHISGIPVFTRKFRANTYASKLTAECETSWGTLASQVKTINHISAGELFSIGNIKVHPFSISHDAVDPLGFRFEAGGAAIAVCSDLGIVTRLVCDRLSGCQAVFCESNHDLQMLKEGSYPIYVKRRVAGKFGHLSNLDCRKLIENIYHPDLKNIVLSHLSQQNNTTRLAYDETKYFLDKIGAKADLKVAFQDEVGTPVEIG